MKQSHTFKLGDWVVYPTHGVGRVEQFETMHVAGEALELILVNFKEIRLTVRIPVQKATATGLRKVCSLQKLKEALSILKQRGKKKGGLLWMQRHNFYEQKLHSGDICAIAEILRDLRRDQDVEVSFSEKTLFEIAYERFLKEMEIVENLEHEKAIGRLEKLLA